MADDATETYPASPLHAEHWCGHPDCRKWGSHGLERRRGVIEWRCVDHLAPDYWASRGGEP